MQRWSLLCICNAWSAKSRSLAVLLSKEEGQEGPRFGDQVVPIQSQLQALVLELTPSVYRDSLPPAQRGIAPVILIPDSTTAVYSSSTV